MVFEYGQVLDLSSCCSCIGRHRTPRVYITWIQDTQLQCTTALIVRLSLVQVGTKKIGPERIKGSCRRESKGDG